MKDLECAEKPSMIIFNKIDNYTWEEKRKTTAPMSKENVSLEELKRTWDGKTERRLLVYFGKRERKHRRVQRCFIQESERASRAKVSLQRLLIQH